MSKRREKILEVLRYPKHLPTCDCVQLDARCICTEECELEVAADWIIKLQDALRNIHAEDWVLVGRHFDPTDPDFGLDDT